MKRGLFLVGWIIYGGVFAQPLELELKNFPIEIKERDFFIQEVWDGRKDTSKIGWSVLNKETHGRVYTLKNGLKSQFERFFKEGMPKETGQVPLILNVTSLIISEKANFMREGTASMVVQFYKEQNGLFGKVYETSFYTESQSEFGKDIYLSHERRIRFLLSNCVKNLTTSKWKEAKPDYISFLEIKQESVERDTLSRLIQDSAFVFQSKKEQEMASISYSEIKYSKGFRPTFSREGKNYKSLWPFKSQFTSLGNKEVNVLFSDYKAKYRLAFFTLGIGAALIGLSFVEGADSGLPNLSLAVPGLVFAGCSLPIYSKSKKIGRMTVDKYNTAIRSK